MFTRGPLGTTAGREGEGRPGQREKVAPAAGSAEALSSPERGLSRWLFRGALNWAGGWASCPYTHWSLEEPRRGHRHPHCTQETVEILGQ